MCIGNRLLLALLATGTRISFAFVFRGHANTSSISTACTLPDFATWCTVRPAIGSEFTMAVYTFNDIVSTEICGHGSWEMRDASELGSPGVAVDIGANIGYYSFLLASAGWHVEAFEPLPRNLELIRASSCQNPELAKKINLHAVGLGANDDNCVFISGHDNVGDGWVRCGDEAKNMLSGVQAVPVGYAMRGQFPVKRLDEILAAPGAPKKIDFVKLDVEGFECQVMKGGDSILKSFRPRSIQSEVWPTMDRCSPSEYLDMFKSAKYRVAKTRGCEIPDSSLTGITQDFFMCKKGSMLLQLA